MILASCVLMEQECVGREGTSQRHIEETAGA
jgi:hypothetical protein